MRAKFGMLQQTHGTHLPFTCEILSRLVYSVVLWRRKTPMFAIFWTLAFSGVANWQQSEKIEHGCTTTDLPLSNDIKIFSVLQHLYGEIERTISDVQKHDKQTNRQTNKQKTRMWPMPSMMVALPNIGGALCSTPQSFG